MLLAASLALALQGTQWPEFAEVSNEAMEARLTGCGFEQVTAEAKSVLALEHSQLAISQKLGEIFENDFRQASGLLSCVMLSAALNDLDVGLIGNGKLPVASSPTE